MTLDCILIASATKFIQTILAAQHQLKPTPSLVGAIEERKHIKKRCELRGKEQTKANPKITKQKKKTETEGTKDKTPELQRRGLGLKSLSTRCAEQYTGTIL